MDAGTGALCTRTPLEWLASCDGDEPRVCGRGHSVDSPGHSSGRHPCDLGPSRAECALLASPSEAERERAALLINDRALNLASLHFSHGYRRVQTVSSLLDDPSSDLGSVIDANRSFAGCIDRRILVPWLETPVCASAPRPRGRDRSAPVAGPENGLCLHFDTMCTRGRFEPTAGCCGIDAAPAGTVCAENALCDGAGQCVDAPSVPTLGRAPDPFDWIALFSGGAPPQGLIASEVAVVVPVLTAPPGLPAESLEIWAPITGELDPGFGIGEPIPEPTGPPVDPLPFTPDVIAVVPASLRGAARLSILRSAPAAALRFVAYDGPVGPHALVLSTVSAPITEVFVVTGPLDRLGAVLSDGSTSAAERVACEAIGDSFPRAAAGELPRCFLLTDRVVIVGADVSLAWVPPSGPVTPIELGLQDFGGNIRPEPTGGLPRDRLCESVACSVSGATGSCAGVQLCFDGQRGACIVTGAGGVGGAEVCDGSDNDCDSAIDEGAPSLCNDGIGCTFDLCRGALGCTNTPSPSMCGLGRIGTAVVPSCVIGVCTNAAGEARSELPGVLGDPVVPAGVPQPSGCSVVLGHSWCTSSWDSCNCNGPETCTWPAGPSADPVSGCFGSALAGPGGGAGGDSGPYDPCDANGNVCDREALCCEPAAFPDGSGDYCRADAMLAGTPLGTAQVRQRQDSCQLAGSRDATWEIAPGTPFSGFLPVRCSPGFPSIPRCIDFLPCTVNSCNPMTGACNFGTSRGFGPVPAESIDILGIPIVSGPPCMGEEPFDSCGSLRCNGGLTCFEDPTGFPAGTTTGLCRGATEDGCADYACDGAGACVGIPDPAIPPGGNTPTCPPEPGYLTDGDCYHRGCFDGFCTEGVPDSALCARPGDCSLPWQCVPFESARFSDDPDVRFGCHPLAAECYYGGTADGTLDGDCRLFDAPPPGEDQCTVCDPTNPFRGFGLPTGTSCDDLEVCTEESCVNVGVRRSLCTPSPRIGAPCNDANDCTSGDACGAFGRCEPGVCDTSRPECGGEFCGAGG